MELYVKTRGTSQDYSWIGPRNSDPSNSVSVFHNLTTWEYNSFVLYRDGSKVRMFLTGINSGRDDYGDGKGRRIRYAIDLRGSGSDIPTILNVLYIGVGLHSGARGPVGPLSKLLESQLGKNIDYYVRDDVRHTQEVVDLVEKIKNGLSSLPKTSPGKRIEEELEKIAYGKPGGAQIAFQSTFIEKANDDAIKEFEKALDKTRYSNVMIFPGKQKM